MEFDSDAQLLARARSGDAAAKEAVLQKYEQRIYRFGLRLCGHEDDARDVLQETLLSAYTNLGAFRGDAQLSTWLYQIARSFCVRQRRRHEGEPQHFESVEGASAVAQPSADSSVEARAHAREVGTVIQAALQSLPADAREVLVLRDVEGLSAEDAATVVGVEVGALKSRLHRARLALKQRLADVLEEGGRRRGLSRFGQRAGRLCRV